MVVRPVVSVVSSDNGQTSWAVSLVSRAGYQAEVVDLQEDPGWSPTGGDLVLIDASRTTEILPLIQLADRLKHGLVVVLAPIEVKGDEIIEAGADDVIPLEEVTPAILARTWKNARARRHRAALHTQSAELQSLMSHETQMDHIRKSMINHLFDRFQNPLVPIRLASSMLKTMLDDPHALRQIKVIESNAVRLENLVRGVHQAFEAPQQDHEQPIEAVGWDALVEEAVERLRPIFESQEVTIHCELTPCQVRARPRSLLDCTQELIRNAIQCSHKGDPVIVRLSKKRDEAYLEIADRGIGFDMDDAHQLFQPFVRPTEPVDSSHSGLGLGLSTAKSRIEGMNGRLGGSSSGTGNGSTFWIALPLTTHAQPELILVGDIAWQRSRIMRDLQDQGLDVSVRTASMSELRSDPQLHPVAIFLDPDAVVDWDHELATRFAEVPVGVYGSAAGRDGFIELPEDLDGPSLKKLLEAPSSDDQIAPGIGPK